VNIIDSPSPNQNARPAGVRPSLVVIHGTVGTDAGDLEWLRKPEAKVSYHYLVLRSGAVHRLVRPERRAWHCGGSEWLGQQNVNNFSIGIGLSNKGDGEPFTLAQYASAGELCAIFWREFGIHMEGVVGHYHISPGRKTDPWYTFQWGRLFRAMAAFAGDPIFLRR
jgi:N-acetylmuramoyl-L-alanine amidase